MSKSMTRSVVLNWLTLGLRMAVGFALLPFILHHVGASGYGYYLLLVSIFGYGLVLDMGFNAVVIRYVSRHAATGDNAALNRILGVIFGFYTILSVIILLVVALLAAFPIHFIIPESGAAHFRWLILLAGISTAAMFHQLGWTSVLRARERFDLSNYIQLLGLIFRTVLIVVLLKRGHGIAVVLLADIVEVVLNGILHRMTARFLFPEIRPTIFGIGRSDIHIVTGYGIWVFFNSLAQQIRYRTHSIIIAAFLPAEAITHYGVAGRLQSYLVNITNNMTTPIRARLGFLEGREDWDGIRHLYLRSLRLVSALTLTLTSILFLESYDFFTAWLGSEYHSSGQLMRILLPGISADMIMTTCIVLVYAIGRHKPLTFILLSEAAAILTSSLLLIRPFGLVGVAIGVSASMLFFRTFALPVYAARTISLPQRQWILQGILPALRPLPVAIGLALLLQMIWSGGRLPAVFLRCLCMSIPFMVGIWFMVLQDEDRAILLKRIRRTR